MIANQPTTVDGVDYPRYSLNLAITSRYLPNGGADANVALRLVPTAVANGEVLTSEENAKSVFFPTILEDPAVAQAADAITVAIQAFLDAKGI